jgi:glycosyltransferase involved in cell wall biosynthesis
VGRLAKTLHEQRWRVILLTRNLEYALPYEKLPYAEVYRVPRSGQGNFGQLLYYHLPISPGWFSFIYQTAKQEGISLLIVRDLPLSLMTGLTAKMLGIPAVLDMREYYPAFVASAPNKRGIRRITKSQFLNDKLESLCLKFFERIFVVIPEVRDKLVKKSYDSDKIDVFCYLPGHSKLSMPVDRKPANEDRIHFVYAGNIDDRRGLTNVVEAFSILRNEGYDFEVTIIASHSKERSVLETRVTELGLNNVSFSDLFPPEELVSSLRTFDVGIINHLPCEHTEATLPMKLFEYMSAGLAVAASNVTPVVRVIDKEQCGLVFEGQKPKDLARTFMQFVRERGLAYRLGCNGFNAVLKRYNWEVESKVLVRAIGKLHQRLV